MRLMKQTRISVHTRAETKIKLDKLARSRRVSKAFVLEQAVQSYFCAFEKLPKEALLPARLVLNDEAFQKVIDLIENPPPPTSAMLALMFAMQNTSATT